MKREQLKIFNNQRVQATGTVYTFGVARQKENTIPTICLTDVSFFDGEAKVEVDHIWMKLNKSISHEAFTKGTNITFKCLVEAYTYAPHFTKIQGYGIRTIRNVDVIKKGNGFSLAEFVSEKIEEGHCVLNYI